MQLKTRALVLNGVSAVHFGLLDCDIGKNVRSVFGTPDFVLRKHRIAIFADSEFWHGKNWAVRKNDHRTNVEFWHQKIEANIKRDKLVTQTLEKDGWKVFRFWGSEIKSDPVGCAATVRDSIASQANSSLVVPSGR